MREIKFRGMTPNDGWVYGTITVIHHTVLHSNHCQEVQCGTYISNDIGLPFAYRVHPETVSQYIGLKDKNGKEIYEGDILTNDYKRILLVVEWRECCFMFKALTKTNFVYAGIISWFRGDTGLPTVIGNIYENPGLMK